LAALTPRDMYRSPAASAAGAVLIFARVDSAGAPKGAVVRPIRFLLCPFVVRFL
jgi:hypothetical protein